MSHHTRQETSVVMCMEDLMILCANSLPREAVCDWRAKYTYETRKASAETLKKHDKIALSSSGRWVATESGRELAAEYQRRRKVPFRNQVTIE